MSTQQPVHRWEDGIDLRQYLEAIVRYKWLVLMTIVVAVAVATIVNFLVLSPTYRSSIVVSLPSADGSDGLGLTPQGYMAFAISGLVVDAVRQQVGSNPDPGAASGTFALESEPSSGLVTITASAQTADAAVGLARVWADVFRQQTLALLQAQLDTQIAVADVTLNERLVELTDSEDALADFARISPLSLTEPMLVSTEDGIVVVGSRLAVAENLSVTETDLVTREQRLRELLLFSIPTDETRQEILEAALELESPTLNDQPGVVVLSGGGDSGAGVTSSEVTILNPVYLQLSEDLALTRIRVGTNRRETEILRSQIVSLQEEVARLRDATVTARRERSRIERDVKESISLYEPAKAELDRLLHIQRRLPQMASPEVVHQAQRPGAPVKPHKMTNIAIAGVLAGLAGVVLALGLSSYRGVRRTDATSPAGRG